MEKEKKFNTKLFKELDYFIHREASSLGLSDSAYTILYAIGAREEGCSQKEIADVCFLSKQTINSAVKTLSKKGLIELKKGKGGIVLKREGKEYYEKNIAPFVQLEERVLELMGNQASLFLNLSRQFTELYHQKLEEVFLSR